MLKKLPPSFLIIILVSISNLRGQEASFIFNRTSFSIFNPAFTGSEGSIVSFNRRSQWNNVEGAPRTNFLIYHFPKKNNVILGLTVQNDRVFVENKTFFTIDYNYQLQLSEKRFLYLGLKGGGFYNDIDINGLGRIYNEFNPALSLVKSYFTPVIGVGVHYKTPSYFFGVGIPNLFDNKRFDDSKIWESKASDYSYFHFSAGFSLYFGDFSINPVFVHRSLRNSPNLYTSTVNLSYDEKISIGGGYSNNHNLALFFTSKNKWGFEWGYVYEFTSIAISDVTKEPAHEIMIRINLDNKPKAEEEQLTTSEDNEE